ncbi:hypothetical protein [Truepera radiovictrix]|uniref:Uncharacterized protein n=1 Tax=Truepera radiovictrix (strain DSM 17093 / CIP 108686 / LMG 22925 / RQ-24) TaxID=649638 RepID=D7CTJ4_TRURR|nr:hypothetical protein [Truepera radiovictrix]ADI13851.1 hypothetical protein Trad_0715 [Truepera radiovictrix DSM 17093]WMT57585.1 hypothetical protein RCV51_01250 [Truepera radiovictrix]
MDNPEADDARPDDADGDTPKELELDDTFEEQKKRVDAWEEEMRQEREKRTREESGA